MSLLAFALGCQNGGKGVGSSASKNSTTGSLGASATSAGPLSQVVLNSNAPSTAVDLLGDGTGVLGNYCTPTQSTVALPTLCYCNFSFTTTAGATQQIQNQSLYQESNLVRCNYAGIIPAGATNITVKIFFTSLGTYSNTIPFNPNSPSGAAILDPSQFLPIQRYQCRDIVSSPYLLDNTIYDPLQSEDSSISYPLNFYTNNRALTYSFYSTNTAAFGYDCPSNANDPNSTFDSRVYSLAGDFNTASAAVNEPFQIYPPATGKFDRSTFYLSRYASGSFAFPVNAIVAPVTTSQTPQSNATGHPPLGYGVKPVDLGGGQERCPTSAEAPIPTGFSRWVKVWLFRADLPARSTVASNVIAVDQANPSKFSGAACNPGNFTSGANVGKPIFADCGAAATSIKNVPVGGYAARILVNGSGTSQICVTRSSPGAVAGYSVLNPDNFADINADAGNLYNCGGSKAVDNLKICPAVPAAVPAPNAAAMPVDNGPLVPFNIPSSARTDYLFVVTPATVNSGDMKNSASPIAQIYSPYRFKAKTDCPNGPYMGAVSATPAADPTCKQGLRINYGFVSRALDAPGGVDQPGVYSFCALQ